MRRALTWAILLAAQPAFADGHPGDPTAAGGPVPSTPIVDDKKPKPDPSLPSEFSPPAADPPLPAGAKPPPAPETPAVPAKSDEPTALDADGAPLPGKESGRTDRPAGDSVARDIGQGVLAVPRFAFETVMAPVRAGVWAYDRFQLSDRFNQAFFDPSLTYGLYPTVIIDSTYGLNIGARFVHRNLAGGHEKLAIRAATGGQFRSLVDGRLRSGTRLGDHVTLEMRGEYERRPREPFYGIGNDAPDTRTRYREEVKRVTGYLDVQPLDDVILRSTVALTDRMYAPSTEDIPIDAMFDTMQLTGFSGVENMYGELEVRWDHRGREISPGRHQIYDTGSMVSLFGGRVHQLSVIAGKDYWRYGGEAQHFIGAGAAPRSLMTRLHVESVTGDRSDVVFDQLPALGGSQLLRGYSSARFRDRAAAVGTLEYFWGIGQMFMASVFVDGGRVYPSFADVSVDNLRVGYGASLQLHGNRQFISGVTVASSIDGGLFLSLTFDPIYEYDPRGDRR